jgi:hypothetical protein
MTSYDNAIFHGTADNFNFVNSLSRIVVECAFDELDFDGVFFGGPCNFPGIWIVKWLMHVCVFTILLLISVRQISVCLNHLLDRSVFDNYCHWYLATHLEQNYGEVNDGGVHGGEQDITRHDDFNQLQGGCPKVDKADSEVMGWQWRDNAWDEVSGWGLIHPNTDWYSSNNHMYDQ